MDTLHENEEEPDRSVGDDYGRTLEDEDQTDFFICSWDLVISH